MPRVCSEPLDRSGDAVSDDEGGESVSEVPLPAEEPLEESEELGAQVGMFSVHESWCIDVFRTC